MISPAASSTLAGMRHTILKNLLFLGLLLFLLQVGYFLYQNYVAPDAGVEMNRAQLPSVQQASSLGINTNEIGYADSSLPFVDLFRAANPFHENIMRLPKSELLEFDANGWPRKLNGAEAGTRFLGELPPDALPSGNYTVLYDGQGVIRYGNDAKLVARLDGRDIISLEAGKNGRLDASLIIEQSNPEDYLRHIRILPAGGICRNNPLLRVADAQACQEQSGDFLAFVEHYDSIIFSPEYLSFMKDFQAIRFMPMSGITRNDIQHWQDRPHMQEVSWGGRYGERGAPLEIMVELANRLHKDAWFNLPHAADDAFVKQFAEYVRDHLHPDLKVYLEYTNEVWNTTFNHAEYTQKKGIEQGLSRNAVQAGYRYYTKRAREIFAIWDDIFGDRQRFIRVLGGWDSRPDFAIELLSYDQTWQAVDALAIAPYFGGNTQGYRQATTVDEIFRLTIEEGSFRSLPDVLANIQKQADIVRQFGVDLYAYEAGQGLVDWATRRAEQHPNPLFFAANRDPRMGDLYTQFLHGWGQAGGKLMMLFSAPRICQWYGCWGLKEHVRQPDEQAPKYAAVRDFMASNPQWWVAQNEPKPAQVPILPKQQDPNEPRIVWRPANDLERLFFLENPRTLDVLLEGQQWNKSDLFGKWQGRWDSEYLYLSVRMYDDTPMHDSEDPLDDDSVSLLIDVDNSRHAQLDGVNDYHFIFPSCQQQQVVLGAGSAPLSAEQLQQIHTANYAVHDGYVLEAWIPWSILGIQPAVKSRVSVNITLNDDDDGGARDSRIAWVGQDAQAAENPAEWGMILFSGR